MLPPNPNIKKLQKRSVTALPIFNNIIFQEAFNFGIPIMDLRLIFNDKADYANPIEPSAIVGMKMGMNVNVVIIGNMVVNNPHPKG